MVVSRDHPFRFTRVHQEPDLKGYRGSGPTHDKGGSRNVHVDDQEGPHGVDDRIDGHHDNEYGFHWQPERSENNADHCECEDARRTGRCDAREDGSDDDDGESHC